jgi:renal tumor antigen
LDYDPDARFSARQALKHPYFKELRQAEKQRIKEHQDPETEENGAVEEIVTAEDTRDTNGPGAGRLAG